MFDNVCLVTGGRFHARKCVETVERSFYGRVPRKLNFQLVGYTVVQERAYASIGGSVTCICEIFDERASKEPNFLANRNFLAIHTSFYNFLLFLTVQFSSFRLCHQLRGISYNVSFVFRVCCSEIGDKVTTGAERYMILPRKQL